MGEERRKITQKEVKCILLNGNPVSAKLKILMNYCGEFKETLLNQKVVAMGWVAKTIPTRLLVPHVMVAVK